MPRVVPQQLLADLHGHLGSAVGVWVVGAAQAVADSPGLQTLLEDLRHHLWASISGNLFWNIEVCKVFSGSLYQGLGIKHSVFSLILASLGFSTSALDWSLSTHTKDL
jgi:hypothetical protein